MSRMGNEIDGADLLEELSKRPDAALSLPTETVQVDSQAAEGIPPLRYPRAADVCEKPSAVRAVESRGSASSVSQARGG